MTFDGRLKFVVLGALSLIYFVLNAATFNALGVILPFMVEDLGWTWAVAGVGFTLLGIACGLSGFLPALLIRRLGVSRTILIGGIVLMSGFSCIGLAQSAYLYFGGTILLGIGYSICGQVPAVNVISHSFERHSTAMGFYFTIGSFGSVAGPQMAFWTQKLTGEWRLYWAGAAAVALVLSIFTALVTASRWNNRDAGDKAGKAAEQAGWSIREALRAPHYYVIVGAYTSLLLINTTVHGFAVQHLSDKGISVGNAATMMSILALVSAGSSAIAGIAGERLKALKLNLLSLGATIVGVVALAIGSNIVFISLAAVGLGIGFGFSYVSIAMLLLDTFGKRHNLELYSAMTLFSTTAAIGPAVGGFVRDQTGSFFIVFVVCATLAFLFFILLMLLRFPHEPAVEDEPAAPVPVA